MTAPAPPGPAGPPAPAARFYRAVCDASRTRWGDGHEGDLLLRLGLPGLMSRLGIGPPASLDESFVRLQKLYHTLLFEAAQEISRELQRSGVEHFFAKGIALFGSVYQPGDRFLADIDLYISAEDRERVIEILATLAYGPLPESDQSGPAELRSALALARQSAPELQQLMVDVHWSLDPVERLLPRRERPIPPRLREPLVTTGPIPVPTPEHHAAILTHHLVHTNLIHVRSLLDLAFVFEKFSADGGAEYTESCRELRIGRFASRLAELMAHEFGIVRRAAITNGASHNRFTKDLTLERWLQLVARAHPDVDDVITAPRIRRRLQLIDHRSAKTLWQDVFFPPAAFLRWRWGGRTPWRARVRHYGHLLRKTLWLRP